MKHQEKSVVQYIARNKSLIATLKKRGPAAASQMAQKLIGPEINEPLRDIVGNLRCRANPDWSPAPMLARLDRLNIKQELYDWLIVVSGLLLCALAVVMISFFQRRERRQSIRHPCKIPALFTASNQTVEAKILDIGVRGAKANLHQELAKGMPCRLMVSSLSLAARVAWSNGEYSGLEFHPPLSESQLGAILAANDLKTSAGGAVIDAA
ncbi:PilZ domain-containing protein [Alisedimentitalea sp. MJ-SS2]|uniref:PilZ domain-containing protein n=1 Tax=Aliisedimentitalea sp. MJ-SS2 TaxID=3049795 RepID=UPI002909C55A|nr:PilZ domain-containing protein [Alisedimentitalea sp. MJ-SS2]MDU8929143.1 PilZ domain-containing protein [Alisedimentitalea sp. MJ-SS2]